MIPRPPYQWRTGQTLSPRRVVENFRLLKNAVDDAQAHRYMYRSFVLDWSAWTTASGTGVTYTFTIPFDCTILTSELNVWVSTGSLTEVRVSGPQGTVRAPISGGLGIGLANTPLAVAAGTTVSFSPLLVGAVPATFETFRLVVSYRVDRGAHGSTMTPWDLDETNLPRSSGALNRDNINAELARGLAAAQASASLTKAMAIQIVPLANVGSGPLSTGRGKIRVPASGLTLDYMQLGVACAATDSWILTVTFPGLSAGSTLTLTGAGATATVQSALTAVNKTQTSTDLSDTTKDSIVTLTRNSGNGAAVLVYAVLFWS